MSEETRPNPWKDGAKEEFEKNKLQEKIYDETVKWLETDEKILEYFKSFQPSTIPSFIHAYARQKARWVTNKNGYENYLQDISVKHKEAAFECLAVIQQKKLFDKQCEWRAEQFTDPAIECSSDFSVWEQNVLNCPFIEPVSQKDIEFFTQYLLSGDRKELDWLSRWQNYDAYKSAFENDEEDDDFPQWYNYHDFKKRITSPLLLPDIRGEKENHFRMIGLAEQRRRREEEMKKTPPAPASLPYLWSGEKEMREFMKLFEKDKSVLRAYKTYRMYFQQDENDKNQEEAGLWEQVEKAMFNLYDCYESLPVFGIHNDWKEAIIATAGHWVDIQTARALPVVYDEYLFRYQSGIAHPFSEEQGNTYKALADMIREQILLGRELSGEPRDFNF